MSQRSRAGEEPGSSEPSVYLKGQAECPPRGRPCNSQCLVHCVTILVMTKSEHSALPEFSELSIHTKSSSFCELALSGSTGSLVRTSRYGHQLGILPGSFTGPHRSVPEQHVRRTGLLGFRLWRVTSRM